MEWNFKELSLLIFVFKLDFSLLTLIVMTDMLKLISTILYHTFCYFDISFCSFLDFFGLFEIFFLILSFYHLPIYSYCFGDQAFQQNLELINICTNLKKCNDRSPLYKKSLFSRRALSSKTQLSPYLMLFGKNNLIIQAVNSVVSQPCRNIDFSKYNKHLSERLHLCYLT